MKLSSHTKQQIIGFVVLILIVSVTIMYSNEIFDFTFIKRPNKTDTKAPETTLDIFDTSIEQSFGTDNATNENTQPPEEQTQQPQENVTQDTTNETTA